VDSSGWLEYFSDSRNARIFAAVIEDTENLIISSLNIYEVYKKVILNNNEDSAIEAAAVMQKGKVAEVSFSIAMQAAKFSYIFKLPMADCIIYITARENNAVVWTQDSHFKELEGVEYISR
jgi:predicted nucleic acid-binding protein